MDTNQPTNDPLVNPLAGHPLLQKKDPAPALVDADFGALKTRVMAATIKAIGDSDLQGPNRGGDAFPKDAAEKPTRYIVPHNVSDEDLKLITERIAKETKLPYEIVRDAVPEAAKEVPAILRSHQGWMREERARQEARFPAQVSKALGIIQAAKRPVKLGYIEQALNEPVFRALEPALNEHPNLRRKTHKNQIYYTWKD